MINIMLLTAILLMHFCGDFILQTDTMAMNKSKSNKWLAIHIMWYTVPMFVFGPLYAIVNALLHACIDYITSRCTSALWKREERHWFFVVIGLDQLVHMLCLIWTMSLIWGS